MTANQIRENARGRSAYPEARALTVASGPRPEVIFALLVIATLLMTAPALVAGVSMIDPQLLAGARVLAPISTWISYLTHAGFVLAPPMVAIAARPEPDR